MSDHPPPQSAPGFASLPDLASRAYGGSVRHANDELFAEKENLVRVEAPGFRPATFGPKGQVYDGWETRRRRQPGFDEAIVRLGLPGVVHGVVVDTSHFTGNYPPEASVDGTWARPDATADELAACTWVPVLERSALQGDSRNAFEVAPGRRLSHVRLRIYPDGGVARLRVHGEPFGDPDLLAALGTFDLAALEHGGTVVDVSNAFYSTPSNLIAPGSARTMGEGWETARRRDDGNDWVVVRLAGHGVVRIAELDTSWFVGNAPGSAVVSGCVLATDEPLAEATWFPLVAPMPLLPDTRHRFRPIAEAAVTHVRLDVFPDGGMARLRLWGSLTDDGADAVRRRWDATA